MVTVYFKNKDGVVVRMMVPDHFAGLTEEQIEIAKQHNLDLATDIVEHNDTILENKEDCVPCKEKQGGF